MIPSLDGEWQFVPYELIERNRNNILVSGCGTGKTTAIAHFLQDNPGCSVIALSFRRSLAFRLASAFGLKNYLEFQGQAFKLEDVHRCVVSIESFGKLLEHSQTTTLLRLPDILIVDEYCSLLEHVFNNATLDSQRRQLFFNFFLSMLVHPQKTVIIADAYYEDIDDEVFESIQEFEPDLSLEKFKKIVNSYEGVPRMMYIWNSPKTWRLHLLAHCDAQKDNLYIFSNWKRLTDGLVGDVMKDIELTDSQENLPILLPRDALYVSSDSSPQLLQSASETPDEIWDRFRYVMVTPSISAGVSYDGNNFDKAFGYAGLNSTSPLSVLQQDARVRHLVQGEVHLCIQKQKKMMEDYPTIQEILDLYTSCAKWTKDRYAKLLEIKFELNKTLGDLELSISKRSITNCFLIRVLRANVFAKTNFLTLFKRLALRDNFDIIEVDAKMGEKLTNDYIEDNPITGPTIKRSTKFSSVWQGAERFRKELLFGAWEGVFPSADSPHDKLATCIKDVKNFIHNWWVLGSYGDINDLNQETDGLEQLLIYQVFSKSAVSLFYEEFVSDGKQEIFHEFILSEYKTTLEDDIREYNIGSLGLKTQILVAVKKILAVVGLHDVRELFGKNWLGADVDTGIMLEGNSSECTPDMFLDPELRSVYIASFKKLKDYADAKFSFFDEQWLLEFPNRKAVIDVLIEYWPSFFNICAAAKGIHLTITVPPFLLNPDVSKKNLQNAIKLVCHAIRCSLEHIGLKPEKKSICANSRITLPGFPNVRHRFYRYRIFKYEERLMISFCRIFKERFSSDIENLIHLPFPDPFHLLKYNVPRFHSMQNACRFRRDTWATQNSENSMVSQLLRKLKNDLKPEKTLAAKRVGLITPQSRTNYMNKVYVQLWNIKYFWELFRFGAANETPLRRKLFWVQLFPEEPSGDLTKSIWPFKYSEDNNEYFLDSIPKEGDIWYNSSEYKLSKLPPAQYYSLTDAQLEELSVKQLEQIDKEIEQRTRTLRRRELLVRVETVPVAPTIPEPVIPEEVIIHPESEEQEEINLTQNSEGYYINKDFID